jgi:hypothetical protein
LHRNNRARIWRIPWRIALAADRKTTTDLDELERKVADISVPLAFREELYGMRLHIELLRKKLKK